MVRIMKNSAIKVIIKMLMYLLLIMFLIYIFILAKNIGYKIFSDQPKDSAGSYATTATIEVKEGETMLEVGRDLESKGIIENAYYFDIAMRFEEKYPYLKPGTYEVSSAMKPSEILDVIAHVDGEG